MFTIKGVKLSSWRATALQSLDSTLIKRTWSSLLSPSGLFKNDIVYVLGQGWNKTLPGCGPPGTEFNTPVLDSL